MTILSTTSTVEILVIESSLLHPKVSKLYTVLTHRKRMQDSSVMWTSSFESFIILYLVFVHFLPILVWAFPETLIFENPYIYFLALKSQQRNYRRAIPQLLVLQVAGDSKEESISGRLMSPTKEAAVNKFSPLSVYFDSNHQSVNQQCTTKIWARSYKQDTQTLSSPI